MQPWSTASTRLAGYAVYRQMCKMCMLLRHCEPKLPAFCMTGILVVHNLRSLLDIVIGASYIEFSATPFGQPHLRKES